MQSCKQSAAEVAVNVSVKFCTATVLWWLIRPHALDIPAVVVTVIFTVNSVVFGYAIRRCFNRSEKA